MAGGKITGTVFLIGAAKLKRINKSGAPLNERTDLLAELYNLLHGKYYQSADTEVLGKLTALRENITLLRESYEPSMDSLPWGFKKKSAYIIILDDAERIASEIIEDKRTIDGVAIGEMTLPQL